MTTISPAIDAAILYLYEDLLGPYWEPERKLVEQGYRDIAVPFEEFATPPFAMQMTWTFDHLLGYLGTWSPRKRFLAERGEDALEIALPAAAPGLGRHRRATGQLAALRARVQDLTDRADIDSVIDNDPRTRWGRERK